MWGLTLILPGGGLHVVPVALGPGFACLCTLPLPPSWAPEAPFVLVLSLCPAPLSAVIAVLCWSFIAVVVQRERFRFLVGLPLASGAWPFARVSVPPPGLELCPTPSLVPSPATTSQPISSIAYGFCTHPIPHTCPPLGETGSLEGFQFLSPEVQ